MRDISCLQVKFLTHLDQIRIHKLFCFDGYLMGRRYRRKNSGAEIIRDSVYIASKLPWQWAFIFGFFLFILFYFLVPEYLNSRLHERTSPSMFSLLEIIFGRRIHWFQWLGVTCGLIGLYFSIRNYVLDFQAKHDERNLVGFIAKLIGRNIK